VCYGQKGIKRSSKKPLRALSPFEEMESCLMRPSADPFLFSGLLSGSYKFTYILKKMKEGRI